MPVDLDEPTEFNARLDRVTRVAALRQTNDHQLAIQPARRAEVMVRDRLMRVADWKADPSLVQSLEWQREAFDYYRLIGQVRYLTTVKANTLAQCRFRLGWRNDQGEIVRTQDPRAMRVWNSLKPPKGGFRALVREYARLRDIAGEAFLVGTPTSHDIDTMEARGDAPGLVWEFLSRQEIRGDRPMQSKLYRDPTGVLSLDTKPIDPRALIARWHFADPEFCVDETTEILTDHGWVTHDQLNAGDTVLTLNHETGQSEWQDVEGVHRFDVVDKPMLSMEAQTHSSLTTLPHRWPVIDHKTGKPRWRTSETLRSNDALVTGAASADIPTEPKWSDALVQVAAFMWTDGWMSKSGTGIGQSHVVNPHHCATIRSALTDLFGPATDKSMHSGWRPFHECSFDGCVWPVATHELCLAHWSQKRKGNPLKEVKRITEPPPRPERPGPMWRERTTTQGMTHFVLNAAAAEIVAEHMPDKIVSLDFVRSLTRSQLELFIQTSIDGDGWRDSESGGLRCPQVKPEALDALELAAVLTGRSVRRSYRTSAAVPMWILTMSKKAHFLVEHRGLINQRSPEKAAQPVNYTGVVWCPTTPNQTWFARRNGRCYFTGNTSLPDSPLRSAIPDMAEYVALRDVISGSIKSRMSAGILCIPEGMSFGQWDMSMEEGGEARDDMDPLMADLFDHMATPLSSRNSIHAFVPLILMGNAEDLKAVRLIELAPDNDTAWATPLREEKLRMIAQDLDVPPEVMEGRGDSNHWTSILVDGDFASKHVIPAGEDLAVFLTEDFLVPLLAIYEQMDEADAERFVVIFDPAPITAKADRGVTALRLFQHNLLSGVATVEANDFTPDDMPDEEELRTKALMALMLAYPAYAPQLLQYIPGLENVEITLPETGMPTNVEPLAPAPAPATEPGEGDEPTGQSGGDPSSGGGMPDIPDGLSAFDLLVARVHTSAEMAAERALERAGSRALNAAKRATVDPAIRDQFVGRAKRDVFTLLSDRDLAKLGCSAVGLLEGSFEEFERFVVQAVCSFRGDYRDAILDAHDIADRLARDMTTLLASGGGGRTFAGMVVPEDLVRCALEVHLGVGAR